MTLRMCEKEREGRERQKIDRENGASKPFSHYRNQASMKLNVTTVIKMVFIASVKIKLCDVDFVTVLYTLHLKFNCCDSRK